MQKKFYNDFGTLKKELKQNGISIAQISSDLGIPRSTLNNRTGLSKSELFYLAYLIKNKYKVEISLPVDSLIYDFGRNGSSYEKLLSFNVDNVSESDLKTFLTSYFSIIRNELVKIKTSYVSIHYFVIFESVNRKWNQENYEKEDQEYFALLEQQLSDNTTAKYTRILNLPIQFKSNNIGIYDSATYKYGRKLVDAELKYVIQNMLNKPFEHVVKCFIKFQDRFELIVTKNPFRLYNTYIINENIILTEYYRYDVNGIPRFDLLFLDKRVDERYNTLIEHHLNDVKKIKAWAVKEDKEVYKIGFTTFRKAFNQLFSAVEIEISKSEKKIITEIDDAQLDDMEIEEERLGALRYRLNNLKEKKKILETLLFSKEKINTPTRFQH